MTFEQWCKKRRLIYTQTDTPNLFVIDEKTFLVIQPKDNVIVTERFEVNVTDDEFDIVQDHDVDFYAFEFGESWYYSSTYETQVHLNPLEYIGKEYTIDKQARPLPCLGVHGGYELCSGSRSYEDWAQKAVFSDSYVLGICEHHTLAGTLAFQQACVKKDVQPILGETFTIRTNDSEYTVKCYVRNKQGWRTLLKLHKIVAVDRVKDPYIEEGDLLKHGEGLICVLGVTARLDKLFIKRLRDVFGTYLYYQFDVSEWNSNHRDREYLEALQNYLSNYYDVIPPALISDAYYLEQDHAYIKRLLEKIGKTQSHSSLDQFYKTREDIAMQIAGLFDLSDKRYEQLLEVGVQSVWDIVEECSFQVPLGVFHMPKYEFTEAESKEYEDSVDMIWSLIEDGLERVNIEDDKIDMYLDRVEKEMSVIEDGGFVDYFLILRDIIRWSESNGILVGAGRGSAGGSLIAYLLSITKVDPLEYDLLFERFLNEGRIGKSLPDIDVDFMGSRRDEVKEYIRQRYGYDHVIFIGTYSTLKMRAAIVDLGRCFSLPPQTTHYYTAMIDDGSSFTDLFSQAQETPRLKNEFIQENYDLINSIPLVFGQPKTRSIHAAGVVIVPKQDEEGNAMTVFDWMPVRDLDGKLISEWEGSYIEAAGFLKEDILGLRQLDKFSHMNSLIKDKFQFEDIDLDDVNVLELFQNGYNEDVFQFGATGLKAYCKELKPQSIRDLIATVALYRPGAMESNAHMDYIEIMNGRKAPEFDFKLEHVTKETGGLYVYQEQVMAAVQVLGGLTLTEADDVRKAMGKKIMDKMEAYRGRFIDGAIKQGCSADEAEGIWHKLEVFAGYGFNKSHATAYAHMGYYSQWYKFHYPLAFWTTSLQFARDDERPSRIAELYKTTNIRILPPEINKSRYEFFPSAKNNSIYWTIAAVKYVGDSALTVILKEREENGPYYSLSEFIDRVPDRRAVDRRVVFHLILAGAFDEIESIQEPRERKRLLVQLQQIYSNFTLDDEFLGPDIDKNHWWIMKQRDVCGYGFLDLESLFKQHFHQESEIQLLNVDELQTYNKRHRNQCAIGVVANVMERQYKHGYFCELTMMCNHVELRVLLWGEIWPDFREQLIHSEGKLIAITGHTEYNRFHNLNVLQTDEKTIVKIL